MTPSTPLDHPSDRPRQRSAKLTRDPIKRRFAPSLITVAVLLGAVLFAASCSGSDSSNSDDGNSDASSATSETAGSSPPTTTTVDATTVTAESDASASGEPDSDDSDPGEPDSNDSESGESGSGESESGAASDDADGLHPDVIGATAALAADGTWTVSATLSSPYDSPERYADAWRVLAPDGTELGVRELGHDHADEQPFTRSLDDVAIPEDVETITIEGRDQVNGWGGATFTLDLAR